jgi:hypothetical protein
MDGWTDADGQPQFRIRNGVDTSMTIGDRPMDIDLSYRPWEISTAAVAALQKELSSDTEQLIAERIAAAIAELPAPKDGIDLEVVQQLINKGALGFPKDITPAQNGAEGEVADVRCKGCLRLLPEARKRPDRQRAH